MSMSFFLERNTSFRLFGGGVTLSASLPVILVTGMFVLSATFALAAKAPVLDVGLELNRRELVVSCPGGIDVRAGADGPVVYRGRPGEKLRFQRKGSLVIGPAGKTAASFRLSGRAGRFLETGGRAYRGGFSIAPAKRGGGLNLVNLVDVESYLRGVLKAEMPPNFHSEALKAQAVVCRTFAMRNKDSFRALGYGLKATEQSQVYRGVGGEDPRTTAAVMATRGIVLTYGGELIEASYHSCCGGRTENNEDVWQGSPKPYTRSVPCPWCVDSPNYEWHAELSYGQIESALSNHGWNLGHIVGIELSYSDTGRVRFVVITTDRGRKVYVPGNKFRIIVDRRKLRSLKFVFRDDPVGELLAMKPSVGDELVASDVSIQDIIDACLRRYDARRRRLSVIGRGFGHGVGLCQWGAQGYAGEGASFRKILYYYYKGTRLRKIY